MNKKIDSEQLQLILALPAERDRILENIERLSTMTGTAMWEGKLIPRCYRVNFASNYVAHTATNSQDSELNQHLVDEALKFYRERLKGIDFLLKLAHEAILKIAPDLDTLLLIMQQGKLPEAGGTTHDEDPEWEPES